MPKEKCCWYRILNSEKISFKNEGEIKTLSDLRQSGSLAPSTVLQNNKDPTTTNQSINQQNKQTHTLPVDPPSNNHSRRFLDRKETRPIRSLLHWERQRSGKDLHTLHRNTHQLSLHKVHTFNIYLAVGRKPYSVCFFDMCKYNREDNYIGIEGKKPVWLRLNIDSKQIVKLWV